MLQREFQRERCKETQDLAEIEALELDQKQVMLPALMESHMDFQLDSSVQRQRGHEKDLRMNMRYAA